MNTHASTAGCPTEAHGTIVVIDREPHGRDRPLQLWQVRPATVVPYFEAVPYHFDAEQFDWFPTERRLRLGYVEPAGNLRLLATTRGYAIALVPAGLVNLGDDGHGGEWVGSRELAGRARDRGAA